MSKIKSKTIVIERIPVPRQKKLRKFDLQEFVELSKKVKKILEKEAKERNENGDGFSYKF